MTFPWNIFQFTDPKMLQVCGCTMWYWNQYLHACVIEGKQFQLMLVEHLDFLENQIHPADKTTVH